MAVSPYAPRVIPDSSSLTSVAMDYSHGSGTSQGDEGGSGGGSREGDGGDGTLDMDMMHNFGAGYGVDMREFPEQFGDTLDENTIVKAANSLITPPMSHDSSRIPDSSGTNGHTDMDDMFKAETGLDGDDDDDDGDDNDPTPNSKRSRQMDVPGGFTFVDKDGESGRRKIRIEYITDKSRRHITFSKRKAGIMKKAYELSILTGTQVLLLVVSETGLVYTFTTTKLSPLVQKPEGKNLIQACLNAPEGYGPDGQPLGGPVAPTKAKNGGLAIRPHKLTASATAALAASAQAAQAQHDDPNIDPAAIAQSTPITARPKKRLPSGRGKKAMQAAMAENDQQNEMIPPVPQMPDLHRQSSPHPQSMLQPLASPLSGGYHIPPEYAHHQASPTSASFGYSPGGPAGDYAGQGFYASPGGHPSYMGVGQGGPMYDPQRDRNRLMMGGDQGSMGMGM